MPLTKQGAEQALMSQFVACYSGTWIPTFVLLSSIPAGSGDNPGTGGQIPLNKLSIPAWPTSMFARDVIYDLQSVRVVNEDALDFGQVLEPISVVAVGVYTNNATYGLRFLGWSVFTDAAGHPITRTFEAGDAIQLPARAFSIGLAL